MNELIQENLALWLLIAGLVILLIVGFILYKIQQARLHAQQIRQAQLEQQFNNSQHQAASFEQQIHDLLVQLQEKTQTVTDLTSAKAKLIQQVEQLKIVSQDYSQLQLDFNQLTAQLAQEQTTLKTERIHWQEKLDFLETTKQQLSLQFKQLANDILEQKTKSFLQQNQQNIGQILNPLNENITKFKSKVEAFYDVEGKERASMLQQIKQLMELNHTLSKDAQNLTKALKGDNKTQGNWGEMILQRVLDLAGFEQGREYDTQVSLINEHGVRQQPDVVVHLSGNRHLIIDSKVSLVAYDDYIRTQDDDALRNQAMKQLIDSMQRHIKELSGKNYQQLYGVGEIDFVLMFIPIEASFMLATSQDNRLFHYAWEKNVLLVSPSTLLFVLRTVAHLLRQEKQVENAFVIAKSGAQLYDELVAFVEELKKVGDKIQQAQNSYEIAMKKLSLKKGNIIKQANNLKQLGVKPSKEFPSTVLSYSEEGFSNTTTQINNQKL